ncbi:MAG: flagellar basal body-associated FliL family protein [Bdellovibrionota bacterium]
MAASVAEEKTDAAHASAALAPNPAASKLMPILTVVNTLATIGMIGILFVSFQHEKKKTSVEDIVTEGHESEGKKEEKSGHGGHGGHGEGEKESKKKTGDFGKMVTLDQFTVNLSTPGSVAPKYFRVNIALEMPTEDAENEVTSKMPQIRNAIIDLINSKRVNDLAAPEGRDYLKEEIRTALNSFLINGKVKGVFFTNFAVGG